MKTVNEAKSILTLEKTIIDKLNFERFSDDVDKIGEDARITFSHNINRLEDHIFRVSLGISIAYATQYDIKAQISGIFAIEDDSLLGKKIIKNNAVAILFPYLRSQLTLLTSQPGFEPIILPVMNINALLNDEE